MAKPFVPQTDIEKLIEKGDAEALLALLRAAKPAEREKLRPAVSRVIKVLEAARFAYDDDTWAGWGRRPTDEQNHAAAVATLVCGTAEEFAEQHFDVDRMIPVAREFKPASLRDLGNELAKTSSARDVHKFVAAGLTPRPDCDEYALGLMTLFTDFRHTPSFEELFAEDPGLKDALLRIFDVEGTQDVSLASVDKYCRKGRPSWAQRLIGLGDAGVYPRGLLVDKALSSLERGWIQYRSGWFSSFHVELAPTAHEMRPHAARYLALLGSRIPPTVTFALGCVTALEAAGEVAPRAVLEALRPVFASAVKGQIESAVKLLERVVKREPALAAAAAGVLVPALAHDSAQVQKAVLRRIGEWDPGGTTRASLGTYGAGIAAVNREQFAALAGGAAKAGAPRVRAPIAPAPAPAVPVETTIMPIATLDELVERVAFVFENDTDIDELERALGALVARMPFDEETRVRFAPVAKRMGKVRKDIPRQLARVLDFAMTGSRVPTAAGVSSSGHSNVAQIHLVGRIDEILKSPPVAPGQPLLSMPTHRRGFIAAEVLVERLRVYELSGIKPRRTDFLTALMRLMPGKLSSALRAAHGLGADVEANALRRALGDDAKVRDDTCRAAADRMRTLLAGGQPSEPSWHIHSEKLQSGRSHHSVRMTAVKEKPRGDPVSDLERQASRQNKYWFNTGTVGGNDEASILYYASLLPADLGNFFAQGATALSFNLDWWEAQWQNKAYLHQLLHAGVPLGSMARLTLALGLAGKEVGQTAIAVDAFVQSVLDGRLDVETFAPIIAQLVAAEHTACARYAKSLRAALRADPAVSPVVARVLEAAVAARPVDPPKDTAALLDLLLEVVLSNELDLAAHTRAALESMEIGGKGAALRKKLLAR